MGDALAIEAKRILAGSNLTVDVIIPVPDTSRVAALQCAQALNIPYREGFVKNRYVGRTFIMPGQQTRRKNVRRKLNAMAMEFEGKTVMLIDDSIVRGTTSKEIIQMARDAGAKAVIMASCAPPIRFPNVFGIDMPSRKELVAYNRTEDEVALEIGADKVVFQTLDHLISSCGAFNPSVTQFDCSVFNGIYVTGGVDEEYLCKLENSRGDLLSKKITKEQGPQKPSSLFTDHKSVEDEGPPWSHAFHGSSDFPLSDPVKSVSDIPPAVAIGLTNQTQVVLTHNDTCVGLHSSNANLSGSKTNQASWQESGSLEGIPDYSHAQSELDHDEVEELSKPMKDSLRVNGGDKDGTVGGMVRDDGGHNGYIPSTPVR